MASECPSVFVSLFAAILLVGFLSIAQESRAQQSKSATDLYKDAVAADQGGDTEKAIGLYRQLLALQPGSLEARSNLGADLASTGHYPEAIAEYQQALKIAPRNSIVRLNLALARYKLGDYQEAADTLSALQKEQELATLKSQINPHFLFNTLNSISAMVSTNAEETRTMIAQLADMLRYIIEGFKIDLVPLKAELHFVKDYVNLESKRMGDRLTTEFQVDQSLATFPIPPMILQPLVENAIKHGISPLEDGGRVTVQIQKSKDTIVFRVSDTGVGLSSADPLSAASGIGLKNIDTRLRRIYGDSAGLEISSPKSSGCEVTFILPSK